MRIIFAGTPEFSVTALQTLIDSSHDVIAVYTQPDRPVGRGRKLKPGPVKALALQAGLPVFQPTTFKDADNIAQMQALQADLMVVVAYGMLLPQQVLDIPLLGCVNIHASLLPRWRGAAPIQRAIMAGDEETGVTIMKMVLKLDAGDMLHKEYCPIDEQMTASELHDKLSELGARALQKVLPEIAGGSINGERQDEAQVTYAHKLEKAEAALDWRQSAETLAAKVRGLNAWPVAQTSYQDKVLRIWRADIAVGSSVAEPGTVQVENKRMLVHTGDGFLNLLEVQLPGGKRMPVTAFLNAHNPDGMVLQ